VPAPPQAVAARPSDAATAAAQGARRGSDTAPAEQRAVGGDVGLVSDAIEGRLYLLDGEAVIVLALELAGVAVADLPGDRQQLPATVLAGTTAEDGVRVGDVHVAVHGPDPDVGADQRKGVGIVDDHDLRPAVDGDRAHLDPPARASTRGGRR